MLRNRLLYLAALAGGTVFLLFLLCLVFLVSSGASVVPAGAVSGGKPAGHAHHGSAPGLPQGNPRRGEAAELRLQTVCRLPQPMCRFRLRMTEHTSGHETTFRARPRSLQMALELPTNHCGAVTCAVDRGRVYDYLGLFRLPRRWNCQTELFGAALPPAAGAAAQPGSAPGSVLPAQARGRLCRGPRARDYRPGDSPREIHWKLTAKVDHPIVREAQVPNQGPVVLTLDLSGSPGELDSCLDQTCWLAQWLLAHGTAHGSAGSAAPDLKPVPSTSLRI